MGKQMSSFHRSLSKNGNSIGNSRTKTGSHLHHCNYWSSRQQSQSLNGSLSTLYIEVLILIVDGAHGSRMLECKHA